MKTLSVLSFCDKFNEQYSQRKIDFCGQMTTGGAKNVVCPPSQSPKIFVFSKRKPKDFVCSVTKKIMMHSRKIRKILTSAPFSPPEIHCKPQCWLVQTSSECLEFEDNMYVNYKKRFSKTRVSEKPK